MSHNRMAYAFAPLTVTDWLDIAPCPPPWNQDLLYQQPYWGNLTLNEAEYIERKCDMHVHATKQSVAHWAGIIVVIIIIVLLVCVALVAFSVKIIRLKKRRRAKDPVDEHVLRNSISDISDFYKYDGTDGTANMAYDGDRTKIQDINENDNQKNGLRVTYSSDKILKDQERQTEDKEDMHNDVYEQNNITDAINQENSSQQNEKINGDNSIYEGEITEKSKL